jgi:hypothetical protein
MLGVLVRLMVLFLIDIPVPAVSVFCLEFQKNLSLVVIVLATELLNFGSSSISVAGLTTLSAIFAYPDF